MRRIILNIMVLLNVALLPLLAIPVMTSADTTDSACPSNADSAQVLNGIGESGSSGCNDSGVNTTIQSIVTLLSYFVGVLAIIMIIVAGTKYITSGGDANRVSNAKGTLIYALIGVAIAALAQLIVHFVLSQASSAGG